MTTCLTERWTGWLYRLGILLLVFGTLPAVWGQTSPVKVAGIEIQHIGGTNVSDELIRSNIRLKVGDSFDNMDFLRMAGDDDEHNLYATGQFYQIRIQYNSTPEGVTVTYVVQARPRLTNIRFQGNVKYKDAKLRKKLTSKIGEPLDEQKLFSDSQEIQKMYQKSGYPGTQVRYTLSGLDESTGQATATFNITEGHKTRITDVEFVGAQAFSQKTLRKQIKTRRHWMFSWITGSGVFKQEQFEDDEDKLRAFYRNHGYIDFEIKDVQKVNPTPQTMVLKFVVYEGRQYKVGSVKFTGEKLFSEKEIATGIRTQQPGGALAKHQKFGPNGLKMDVGDVFTPDGLRDDIVQIEDFYGARGYIDVATSSHGLDVRRIPNTDTGTMDLEFSIDAGQKNYIEKIEIRGNTKTKDRVIRRELAVSPGEVFDMVRVNQSKDIIEGLRFFEPGKVDVRPEPTDIPNHKNLVISVQEQNTGHLMMGAGFSSVDALVGFAEMTQGNFDLFNPPNFTGAGQKFRLRAQLGTERQDYEMEFIEPWFLERRLALDVNLFYRNLDYLSLNNLYNETIAGARLGLLRELPKPTFLERLIPNSRLIGGVGYSLENIGIHFNGDTSRTNSGFPPVVDPPKAIPNALLAESGYALVSKFTASLALDTRGPGLLPDRGQRTELALELAGPFGGEKNYYHLDLKSHWYIKGFASGHVLEVVGGVGTAEAYGSTPDVPFYDRFYLGGPESLRGFKYRSVSPREADSGSKEPIGGNSYWFGSLEYSIPVIERLRFALFYDIGNVESKSYSFSMSSFSDNWGVGLRLNLPIGPLRLDYGIPIHHDKYNGSSGQFQFGASFDRPF